MCVCWWGSDCGTETNSDVIKWDVCVTDCATAWQRTEHQQAVYQTDLLSLMSRPTLSDRSDLWMGEYGRRTKT